MTRGKPWTIWVALFGAALALGSFSVLVTTVGLRLGGQPGLWSRTSTGLLDWILWALFAPGVVLLARRFPIERGRIARGVGLHLGLGAVVAVIELGLFTLLSRQWLRVLGESPELPVSDALFLIIGYWLSPAMFIYWTIVAAVHAIDHHQRARERERTVGELRFQLADARLQALEMQLHPHFLYNTLNTISALVREKRNNQAVEMVARLGDLLRATLQNAGEQLVPLHEEVGMATRYLDIERVRRGDRLVVRYDIDPESLDALVPNLLLQPLVENAVRHGLSARPGSHRVEIRSRRRDGTLQVEVVDDGPGFRFDPEEKAEEDTCGVGIRNTLERLGHLYGDAYAFRVREAEDGGARVEVEIPWRTAGRVEAPT